jgi:hypothetical protein
MIEVRSPGGLHQGIDWSQCAEYHVVGQIDACLDHLRCNKCVSFITAPDIRQDACPILRAKISR